jgi:hypothetical protein
MRIRAFPASAMNVAPGYVFPVACIAVFMACTSTGAQSIYRPQGLQPGDQYRLVFVTEGKQDALSSNIADYNAFVTNEANAPNSVIRGLATEWFTIASTADVDAIENTETNPSPRGQTGVPIYLVDGQTRFAEHYDNLWDGDSYGRTYLGPLHLTQYGVAVVNPINNVWTGTNEYGVAGGFGGPLGSPHPSLGAAPGTFGANGRWINNNFRSLDRETKHLYAISPVLVAVPEPPAIALLCTSLIAFLRRR